MFVTYFKSICTIMAAFVVIGCSENGKITLGQAIPANSDITKLTDILASPAQFTGKTVVLKGVISGQCPSLCEFFYKEGVQQATVFPQGFKFPKLPTGKPVTVYAQITAGEENVVVSALGIAITRERK